MEELKNNKVFKVHGSNLYFLDDLVFIDTAHYEQFYRLMDAFEYYKEIQSILNKNIIFMFQDNSYFINKDTTYSDICGEYNKNNKKEDISGIDFRKMYIKYLKRKKDSLYKLLYKEDNYIKVKKK